MQGGCDYLERSAGCTFSKESLSVRISDVAGTEVTHREERHLEGKELFNYNEQAT
jgi:hypothetical protein